jgi:hypothetical protein
MVYEVGCCLRHAPRTARRAKPAPLAAQCDQLVVAAVAAAQSQEAVGQDAALEEGVELILEELRQVGASSVFGLGEEGCTVRRAMAAVRLNRSAAARFSDRPEDRKWPMPGLDVAMEALQEARASKRVTVDELWRYATLCRVANVMRPYLESLS